MKTGKIVQGIINDCVLNLLDRSTDTDMELFNLALRRIRDVINAVIPFDTNIDQ